MLTAEPPLAAAPQAEDHGVAAILRAATFPPHARDLGLQTAAV
jgi:hypothetical protein